MAEIILNDLPEDLVTEIRRRALDHGISFEEELRRILTSAIAVTPNTSKPKKSLWEHLMDMPDVGEDWMFDRHDPRNASPERPKQFDFDPEA